MSYCIRVKITKVNKGSLAETEGLQVGDIILNYNGLLVDSCESLSKEMESAKAFDSVNLRIKRSKHIIELDISTGLLGINFEAVRRNENKMESIPTGYLTPKKIATAMTVFGWIIFGLGILVTIIGALTLSIQAFAGIGSLLSGGILILVSQLSIALMDNADISRESLFLQRQYNERKIPTI